MFIVPNYAQTIIVKINIRIIPTYFGVNTPSSGSLQVVLAKVPWSGVNINININTKIICL